MRIPLPHTLKTVREGTIVTVRKVEEVILEVQIGVARPDREPSLQTR